MKHARLNGDQEVNREEDGRFLDREDAPIELDPQRVTASKAIGGNQIVAATVGLDQFRVWVRLPLRQLSAQQAATFGRSFTEKNLVKSQFRSGDVDGRSEPPDFQMGGTARQLPGS